jgi:hypothetical protein
MLFLALISAVGVAGPGKLASYSSRGESVDLGSSDRSTLVFVHEDWESRLGARLSALGMRLDSIRAVLRFNATCAVERFVAQQEALHAERLPGSSTAEREPTTGDDSSGLRFDQSSQPRLRAVRMPSGALIRTYDGEALTPDCERQAASDFHGVVALPPLLWQGDLPDLGSAGAMFVRDLGWDHNAALIERLPERESRLLIRRGAGRPELVPYNEGMRLLWPREVDPQLPGGRRP